MVLNGLYLVICLEELVILTYLRLGKMYKPRHRYLSSEFLRGGSLQGLIKLPLAIKGNCFLALSAGKRPAAKSSRTSAENIRLILIVNSIVSASRLLSNAARLTQATYPLSQA